MRRPSDTTGLERYASYAREGVAVCALWSPEISSEAFLPLLPSARRLLFPRVFRLISAYSSLKQLGEGTYGVVFKCKDLMTGQLVALKRMKLDAWVEGVPATAVREVSTLKELNNDNVVKYVCRTSLLAASPP